MANSLKNIFQKNVEHYSAQYLLLDGKHKRLSALRLLVFVVFISTIIYAANARDLYLLTASLFAMFIIFGFIIRIHNRVKYDRKNSEFLKDINEREIDRLESRWTEIYPGSEYRDKSHFYTGDLDIFGFNSLFQLLVRSHIPGTRSLAAERLSNHYSPENIQSYHEGIREIKDECSWRQELTALGMHVPAANKDRSINQQEFLKWIESGTPLFQKTSWIILSYVMPILGLVSAVLILFFNVNYQLIFLPILINLYFLKLLFEPLSELTKKFDKAAHMLRSYENLIKKIEGRKFNSSILINLQKSLNQDEISASRAISKLRWILNQLLNRSNMLYFPLNMVFLLDLIWLIKAEKWKSSYGNKIKDWFDAIHEFDLINDMAGLAYANPDFTIPTLSDAEPKINATGMGHPLIAAGTRVSNDFNFDGEGQVGLVTGSNMSGKSTFLRTVGLNLVMAQSGLPVCAESFLFTPMRVFTSMRTEDNLEENMSSFYAELSRIKLLLDSFSDETIFYLLDEILKGTNSDDRHTGSVALIDQVSNNNSLGLISTHDLSLSKMSNDKVVNYSFNSEIKGDEILFNYKLTSGPCHSFNASKLMQNMGIIISDQKS